VVFVLIVAVVVFMLIPVTGILLTVTVVVAVLLPSCDVAVITTVPKALVVTNPFASTVATAVLLDDHTIFWFVALPGAIVAVSCFVVFIGIVAVAVLMLMPVTGTLFTVNMHESFCALLFVITVIVALPGATAVIRPKVSTVAIAALLDTQVTV